MFQGGKSTGHMKALYAACLRLVCSYALRMWNKLYSIRISTRMHQFRIRLHLELNMPPPHYNHKLYNYVRLLLLSPVQGDLKVDTLIQSYIYIHLSSFAMYSIYPYITPATSDVTADSCGCCRFLLQKFPYEYKYKGVTTSVAGIY